VASPRRRFASAAEMVDSGTNRAQAIRR
jgi:hypothetical protein